MEGCSGMCEKVFKKDVLDLLQLLEGKDIKIKVSQYETEIEGYKQFGELETLQFVCHNFNFCSKTILNCINEDNIYEIEFFRIEGSKWCFGSKYRM